MTFEQAPDGFPTGYLITMLQYGDEQGIGVFTFQVNQRRTIQQMVQRGSRTLKQPRGQMVKFGKFHCESSSRLKNE